MRPRKLPLAFFRQGAVAVAQALIGKIFVHRPVEGPILRARIVETEAYIGPKDLASHASKGVTKRTAVMYGPPGRAYVYFIYGMHEMFNVVVGQEGNAEAVLIRAGEPLDDWTANLTGPGRFTKGMRLARNHNHVRVTGPVLYFLDNGQMPSRIERSRRVGVDYAREWADELLRFYDGGSKAVSKARFGPGESKKIRS